MEARLDENYFITYPEDGSQEGLLGKEEEKVTIKTREAYKKFDYFVALTHWVGVTMLVLNGKSRML